MAHTYCVDWTVTYSHVEVIEAESKEKALELARKLLESERFLDFLLECCGDDYFAYSGPNDPVVLEGEDALTASLDEEDINYYLGLED